MAYHYATEPWKQRLRLAQSLERFLIQLLQRNPMGELSSASKLQLIFLFLCAEGLISLENGKQTWVSFKYE